jgi:hypothetical protein
MPLRISVVFPLVAIGFGVFAWDCVTYTASEPGEERCYSPNHEYYVVRLQTPFNALVADPLYVRGTAELYDKTGRLLYSGKTDLDYDAGPTWAEGIASDGGTSSVSFIGNSMVEGEWFAVLPSSPGKALPSEPAKPCF